MQRKNVAIPYYFLSCLLRPWLGFGNTVIMSFTALPTAHESNTYSSSTNASYNGYSTATIAGIPSQDVMCDFFDAETTMPSGLYTYDSFHDQISPDGRARAIMV